MTISVVLLFTMKSAAQNWDWFQCVENTDAPAENNTPLNELTSDVASLATGIDVPSSVQSTTCYGTGAVLRMSFTLFVFHLLILLAIVPRA
jgi:hypothetical protein